MKRSIGCFLLAATVACTNFSAGDGIEISTTGEISTDSANVPFTAACAAGQLVTKSDTGWACTDKTDVSALATKAEVASTYATKADAATKTELADVEASVAAGYATKSSVQSVFTPAYAYLKATGDGITRTFPAGDSRQINFAAGQVATSQWSPADNAFRIDAASAGVYKVTLVNSFLFTDFGATAGAFDSFQSSVTRVTAGGTSSTVVSTSTHIENPGLETFRTQQTQVALVRLEAGDQLKAFGLFARAKTINGDYAGTWLTVLIEKISN